MSEQRPKDWETRLEAYLKARRATPFEWGSHDCCRFACAGLAAQGVPDPMAKVRPYKTARGAADALRRLGGTLDDAATTLGTRAGLVEVAPAFAGRGAAVLAEVTTPWGTTEPALGLVGLSGIHALFAGARGLVTRRLFECRRAWVVR